MLILKPLSIDWSVAGANIPAVTFIAQAGLPARELAHMLDSLVRVSRRVEWNHLVIVFVSGRCTGRPAHSPKAALRTQSTATRHAGIDTPMSAAKGIRPPVGRVPCPWWFTRWCTDGDTQGKKHHARPSQNQLPPLRLNSQQSLECATISPRTLVPFASLSAISGTFNSLFKVLFTFPSWYLFAIGLEPIFSFR